MKYDMTTPKPWKDKKAALKAQYPDLTEEDLRYTGDVDQLIRNIQRRTGKSQAQVQRLIIKI